MSDLTLRINADFDKATKAFEELASTSEDTRKKLETYSKTISDKTVDDFTEKQKKLQIQMTGTRGETIALQKSVDAYQKEIERHIRNGLNPNHEAIIKLKNEQEQLSKKIKEANEIQKSQTDLMKLAENATKACYAAIGAGVAAITALTQNTAKMGDEFAKAGRVVGLTAEEIQTLDYAAKQSGVKNLNSHLEVLNRSIIGVKNDTGNLTKYLNENNTELLEQLKNVNNNDEAFSLLINEIHNIEDPLRKSELAMAAFGKSGNEILLMAENGVKGLNALKNEARQYGIISNETARASEEFLSAQTRLKAAINGVGTELTGKLIPSITLTINKIVDFIVNIDDWKNKIDIAIYALAGLTAGLTTFLIITKGATAIHTLTTAFKALTAAMASNPLTTLAVVITAVLIPALIALYKNWDTIQTYIQQGIANLEYMFKWFSSQISEKFTIAINGIKIAFLSLAEIIVDKVLGGVSNLLNTLDRVAKALNIRIFENAANSVNELRDSFSQATKEAQENSRQTIQNAKDNQDAIERELRAKLNQVNENARLRRLEIENQKKRNDEEYKINSENAKFDLELMYQTENEKNNIINNSNNERMEVIEKNENELNSIRERALRDRLNDLSFTEKQILNQQIDTIKSFLLQRARLEADNIDDRILYLENHKDTILNLESLTNAERIAAEQALAEAIIEIKNSEKNNIIEIEKKKNEEIKKINNDDEILLLKDRLNNTRFANQNSLNEQIKDVELFLKLKTEAYTSNHKEQLDYLTSHKNELLLLYQEGSNERIAIEQAMNNEMKRIQREQADFEKDIFEKKISAYSEMFGSLSQLFGLFAKESEEAAVFQKLLAIADVAISTSVAIMRAWAQSSSWQEGLARTIALAAQGTVQSAIIAATNIPSKETGGRFIVPQSNRVDDKLYRFNGGEEVEVTPRNMTGNNNEGFKFNFIFDGQVFAEIINKQARAGELYTLQLAGNL